MADGKDAIAHDLRLSRETYLLLDTFVIDETS
jgi:hypothetical protein